MPASLSSFLQRGISLSGKPGGEDVARTGSNALVARLSRSAAACTFSPSLVTLRHAITVHDSIHDLRFTICDLRFPICETRLTSLSSNVSTRHVKSSFDDPETLVVSSGFISRRSRDRGPSTHASAGSALLATRATPLEVRDMT